MKKFVILTDSCADLDKDLREKYGIDYLPMHFTLDGKEYLADLDWGEISASKFYQSMREGKIVKTSQVTVKQFEEKFESLVADGNEVLYISCSSALSASIKESIVAKSTILEKYPDAKIECVDSLNSCLGQGIMCVTAAQLREEGLSLKETAEWLEKNRLKVNQECTVEKLTYLKNAGRVSAASAFFGGIFSVKPIIISDAKGNNNAVEKVKGRKTSIVRLAERVKEEFTKCPYQKVYFAHADSIDDVNLLKEEVAKRIDMTGIETHTGYVGPIVGGSAGPGTIAVYFFGTEVTVGK